MTLKIVPPSRLANVRLLRQITNRITVVTKTWLVEKCPEGYPRLAAFLSSEHNFSIYRGFTYLHSRVLLGLQDQLVALERELDMKDRLDKSNNLTDRLRSRARDEIEDTGSRSRSNILNDIRLKLGEYGMFL